MLAPSGNRDFRLNNQGNQKITAQLTKFPPAFKKGVRQSRRKTGVSILTAQGFYVLQEFAYLSRLPTRHLTQWVKAMEASWPKRRHKPVSSPEHRRVLPTLKPTYISAWRKMALRPSWLIADMQVDANDEAWDLDFRINYYELRCQNWQGDGPNALMLVIFERRTETLCHQLIKLSHIQKGRLDKIIRDTIAEVAIEMWRFLELQAGAVRFNFPSGKRSPDLYQATLTALPVSLGANVSITIAHYRSRKPLRFGSPTTSQDTEVTLTPSLRANRVDQRQQLHRELHLFNKEKSVPELANFWHSMAAKMNKYFEKHHVGTTRFVPCWIDLTKRSTLSEFTNFSPKKRARQSGIQSHHAHWDV